MSWSISTRDIPRIECFKDAARLWDKESPWRTELAGWRPLTDRRSKHKRIVRILDGEAYQIVLYTTPIVTYYRDGSVELQTYDSSSTVQFAWCVRPSWARVHSVGGVMYWSYPSQEGERFVRQGDKPLYLQYVGINRYDLLTKPAEDFEWKLDLKRAASTRKWLSHYEKWEKMTTRLTGRKTHKGYVSRGHLERLLNDPDNHENFPDLLPYLGTVEHFRQDAYEVAGARTQVPVPYTRLPRRQR